MSVFRPLSVNTAKRWARSIIQRPPGTTLFMLDQYYCRCNADVKPVRRTCFWGVRGWSADFQRIAAWHAAARKLAMPPGRCLWSNISIGQRSPCHSGTAAVAWVPCRLWRLCGYSSFAPPCGQAIVPPPRFHYARYQMPRTTAVQIQQRPPRRHHQGEHPWPSSR
jgi:hypothetical protein